MAQVKLIETEQPQQFKPVTIEIKFETQEEINALRSITGLDKTVWDAASSNCTFFGKSTFKDYEKVSNEIFYTIEPFAK